MHFVACTQPYISKQNKCTFQQNMKYTINNHTYNSKAAVRREWKARIALCQKETSVKLFAGVQPTDAKVISAENSKWFIEAALQFSKQRSRLYPTNGTVDLQSALANTIVFIDSASRAFGKFRGKHSCQHGAKCVFFQNARVLHQFRTVSSQLDNVDSEKDTRSAVISWMRREIQCQINSFRNTQKLKKTSYKCCICDRLLQSTENHVDHGTGVNSFKSITAAFEATLQGRFAITDMNPRIAKKWRLFHKAHAELSMTCRHCNLTNK